MKNFLVFVVIICMALFVGAQESSEVMTDQTQVPLETVEEVPEEELVKPIVLPVTRLNVTIIDGLNDKLIKLENCVVQVIGELHIVEDSFNYSNTFVEGDRYEITIHIRVKK